MISARGNPLSTDRTRQSAIDEILRQSVWTRELGPEEFRKVRETVVEQSLPAGCHACRNGDPAEHWIGVIDGLIKISGGSADGKSVTFTGVTAGGWFGEGSLLKDEPRRYDGIAVCNTRIARMPRSTFTWLLDNSIPFNRFLLNQLNERLGLFIAMVGYDRLLKPEARVARCLATLFNPYLNPNSDQCLQLSQEEAALLCGMSRQRVNQALHTLEKENLLSAEYGQITILDLARLRSYGE